VHDQVDPSARTTDREDEIELHTRRSLPPVVELTLGEKPGAGAWGRAVEKVLQTLGGRFGLVIVDFPQIPGGAAGVAEDACDRVIRVVGARPVERRRSSRVFDVVNCLEAPHASAPLNHCEPFMLPIEPRLERARADRAVRIVSDSRSEASRVLARLARKIMGATVGIALGGGGAFGIAHVGVLSALSEAGLPIDLVAGTSMGSIIALGYAAGISPAAMVDIAGRIGNVRTALSAIDPSLTGTGLLNGRRLVSIFGPLLPHASFDELSYPCRVVAMDVETGERVDIGSGRLDNAFRASCSIPVVFKPVRVGQRTLVDGGMIDPVPADVARDMGADVVIAVNVVPHLKRGVSTAISRTFKRVNRLNPLSYVAGARNMPDIVDVLMNSLQMTEYELGNFKSLDADVLINVDMAEFTWVDFHRALDIVKRGHEAGMRAAPRVDASLRARLAPLLESESARI
jgi:NTE family protein